MSFLIMFKTEKYQADTRIFAADKEAAILFFWEKYASTYPNKIIEAKVIY